MELTFLTALTLGFLGSTHCIGMCGGIVAALNSGLPEHHESWFGGRAFHHLTYNAGRISSYVAAGAAGGLIGTQAHWFSPDDTLPIGALIAGFFMIALGLYLAGWWRAIAGLEALGQFVWRRIQPLGKRFLPVRNPVHAYGLGLVWGWLPCGLVYSALALAVISGSPATGAMLMFGFGLGTLPMLLAMGRASELVLSGTRKPVVRQVAGVIVALFGAFTIYGAVFGGDHHHHHGSAQANGGTLSALTIANTAYSLVYSDICETK